MGRAEGQAPPGPLHSSEATLRFANDAPATGLVAAAQRSRRRKSRSHQAILGNQTIETIGVLPPALAAADTQPFQLPYYVPSASLRTPAADASSRRIWGRRRGNCVGFPVTLAAI